MSAPSHNLARLPDMPVAQTSAYALKRIVAEDSGISVRTMLSNSRKPAIARARMTGMYLHKLAFPKSTLAGIGRSYRRPDGGVKRDHTTVLHALRRVSEWMAADPAYAQGLLQLGDKVCTALNLEIGPLGSGVNGKAYPIHYPARPLGQGVATLADPNPLDRSIT